jgi:hypothetical protein
MTEIVLNDAGEPYWFVADREGLREAIAAIPADMLREANERQWLDRGLEPPKRSVRELRQRLVDKHEHKDAGRQPDERVLPVEEAARHLGTTGRRLHYAIQLGEYADAKRELRDGKIGLAFRPPPRSWSLVVERPDPRVLVAMVKARVQPGESFEWRMLGEETTRTHVRRSDGANWKEKW